MLKSACVTALCGRKDLVNVKKYAIQSHNIPVSNCSSGIWKIPSVLTKIRGVIEKMKYLMDNDRVLSDALFLDDSIAETVQQHEDVSPTIEPQKTLLSSSEQTPVPEVSKKVLATPAVRKMAMENNVSKLRKYLNISRQHLQ